MKRHLAALAALAALLTGGCAAVCAATPEWHAAAPLARGDAERLAAADDSPGFALAVSESGVVTLTLARTATVRVLTILGQPIMPARTLNAGVHRLGPLGRGIYIVRIGSATQRIKV